MSNLDSATTTTTATLPNPEAQPQPQPQPIPQPEAEPRPDHPEPGSAETNSDLIDPVTATHPKPSSPRRIAASRANGALSSGPTTAEGLARLAASPRNLRHGLLAQSVVLATESATRFDALLDELIAEYQPQTRSEYTLVEMMAVAMWRHRRALTIQKTDFDLEIARHQSTAATPNTPPVAASAAHRNLHHKGHTYSTAIRYENTFERQYHRARLELRLLQRERLNDPQPHVPANPVTEWKEWTLNFDNISEDIPEDKAAEVSKK